jgi:ATP-dependent Lon protease
MANISAEQREGLGKVLNDFIHAIRAYVKSSLSAIPGKELWHEHLYNCLHPSQQTLWENALKDGTEPEELIDYGHLKAFAIQHKSLLWDDFGKVANRLPTWFDEINDIRTGWAHHKAIEPDDFTRGLGNIKRIAEALGAAEIRQQAEALLAMPSPAAAPENETTMTEEEPMELTPITAAPPSNALEEVVLDALDEKLLEHFRGYVVKKDLVRTVKIGANVPVFVLEYLIASACSTNDLEKIKTGMANVRKILSDHYVNPEESTLIHSKIKEQGRYKIIDKISVHLDSKRDTYWATLQNSNIKNANIQERLVREHEKMLMGGVWAVIDVEYDPNIMIGSIIFPFCVEEIRPIQLSSFDNSRLISKRAEFSTAEWLDVLLRSCGYEPTAEGMSPRLKMLLLSRLLPLVEANFNFIELGPRSTGKSFVFKELSPYSILISGGQGTVAKLFVHGSTGRVGAVGQWDAICFDEATDKIFKERDAIPLMKDYMESGSFSRAGAGGEITGVSSIILNGNINQPVETVLQTSHLFAPLSDEVNNDTAFLDRLHFYLPGWEVIKFAPQHFTNHFGFSTDYFSECLKSFRKRSFTDALDEYFALGAHLKQRDTKPVRKTVSAFIKLLHPDGKYTKEEVRQYLEIALEMRRRVKEQLKRIGGMEFWDTNFSYIDKETQEEVYVGLPEEKGSQLIESTPLPPGVCYSCTSEGDSLALVRIEAVAIPGSGKLYITGISSTRVKENVQNTYQYIKANEKALLNERHSLRNYDLSVQVTTVLGANPGSGIGAAVFMAIISALYRKNLKPGLGILGNISVGGAIERAINFPDKVTMLSENGAKTVIVPMDNLPEVASLPAAVLGRTDVPFYSNTQMLLGKGVLME